MHAKKVLLLMLSCSRSLSLVQQMYTIENITILNTKKKNIRMRNEWVNGARKFIPPTFHLEWELWTFSPKLEYLITNRSHSFSLQRCPTIAPTATHPSTFSILPFTVRNAIKLKFFSHSLPLHPSLSAHGWSLQREAKEKEEQSEWEKLLLLFIGFQHTASERTHSNGMSCVEDDIIRSRMWIYMKRLGKKEENRGEAFSPFLFSRSIIPYTYPCVWKSIFEQEEKKRNEANATHSIAHPLLFVILMERKKSSSQPIYFLFLVFICALFLTLSTSFPFAWI